MSDLTVNANDLEPWTPDIDPRRKAKAGIISGTNFIDDLDGPASYFSSEMVNFNFWAGDTRAKVSELRLTDEIVYGTPTGIWRINVLNGEAELILRAVVTNTFWPWTVAYVGGLYYFAQYDIGLWEYDQDAEILVKVALPGAAVCRGVADNFGRLIYLTPDNVGVSALDDGSDLTPSLTTGAHQQTLSLVGGVGYRIGIVPDGYLVYLSNGILKGTFTQAAYVFTYAKLTDAVKLFSSNAVVEIPLIGILSLDQSGFNIIKFDKSTGVPVPWEIEKSDYIVKNIIAFLNRNLNGTIAMYFSLAEQKLFVSFSDNTREGVMIVTFVYVVKSQKWGSFDSQHTGLFETIDPNTNIYSCSYMALTGYMMAFSSTTFTQNLPPSPYLIDDYLYRIPTVGAEPPVKTVDIADVIVQTGFTNVNFSNNIPTAYDAYDMTALYYMNYYPYSDTQNDGEDDPPFQEGPPIVAGTYINIDMSGGVEHIALPYELPKVGLNSILTVGPFRFSDQQYADETSLVSTLIVGLAPALNFVISEDWNILVGNEDWNVETGNEDWGSGITIPNTFDLILISSNDGISAGIQGNEDLVVFNDLGSSLQYNPLGYSGIYHILTLEATEPGQAFALKFLDFTGQLTGRLQNQ